MPTPKTKQPLSAFANAAPDVDLRKPVKLGINLFDIMSVNPFIRSVLLVGKVDLSKAIPLDPNRPDERLIEFSCPLLEAAMTLDLIRNEGRQEQQTDGHGIICRAYIKKGETWSKLPVHAVLAIANEKTPDTSEWTPTSQWILNPTYFPIVEEIAPLAPPKPERVLFKKPKGNQ